MLWSTDGARRFECEAMLFGNLGLRDELALGVAVAPQEVAETTAALRELSGAACRTVRSRTLELHRRIEGRIVADHLRERASLRVFWIQAAGEIPAEAAESLGHRMPLGALLVARAITEIAGADALLLLVDERLKLSPEATEHIAPISATFGNGVELLLHACGKAEVNERGEVRREQIANRLAKPRCTQSVLAIALHIFALLNALNDRGVR